MTDTFDSEQPHNPDGEERLDEPRAVEAPAEAPSDDEFIDEPPPEEKKTEGSRRSGLPVVVAIAGVILLGSVAWWQFGGQASQLMGSANKQPSPQSNALPSGGARRVAVSETPINAPKAPDSSVQQKKEAEASSPSPGGFAPAPRGAPPDSGAKPALPENVAQAAPPALGVPAQASAPALKPVSQTPAVVAPPPPMNDESARRIDALSARIDILQKALDQANQQLGQMTGALAASSDLGARLDKLEQRLGPPKRTASAQKAAVAADEPSDEPARRQSPRHKKLHKEARNNSTPRYLDEPAKSWVLRAASPERAWVSETSTSKDLREIRVGDSVPGIGKVLSIDPQGDQWVVRGTKKSIQ